MIISDKARFKIEMWSRRRARTKFQLLITAVFCIPLFLIGLVVTSHDAHGQLLKQSTAVSIPFGPMVTTAAGTGTYTTAIPATLIYVTKNGAAPATKSSATASTHQTRGWHTTTLDTTDTGTLGRLTVFVRVTGKYQIWKDYMVVPANVYDSIVAGSDVLQADMTQIQGTAPNTSIAGTLEADVFSISKDTTAADNLELQYDTTGLTGDTFPATQSQINQVANISGVAKRAPDSYVLTTGTQSANTVAATEELDGTRHEHTDTTGEMDLYYEFNIGAGLATDVTVTGYLQGNNDDLEVYGFDWVSVSWKQIGTLEGQASATNVVNNYALLVDMAGSGANEGIVRVRFTDGAFTLTTATLAIDQILVEFAQGLEGYQNGAIWLDTNASNTNTVRGVDGTATNPVSTIAAVNTLLASTNLSRVEVAPQSSITFAATQANQRFTGRNWTLALGGQSISGSFIEGANVTGIGTGASEIHFDHCHFGAVTLPPSDFEDCVLEDTITIGTAGNFFFEGCFSGVAGTGTPVLDFGAALNASSVNFRGFSGGIEIQNMGAGTGSYNMSLEGWGQYIINANCSATSTLAVRGHFTQTDNAGGAVTVVESASYEDRLIDQYVWTDPSTRTLTAGAITTATFAAGAIDAAAVADGAIDTGYTGGAVYIDTNASNTNTVSFVDGVEHNPVSTLVAATTIAAANNIKRFYLVAGSSITLAQAYDNHIFDAYHATVALGSQSINNSVFIGAVITGNDDGSNVNHVQYFDCVIGTNTLAQFVMTRCYFMSTLTLAEAGTYYMHQCFSGVAGTGAPVLDFGAALNASSVNVRDYSGGMEVANMGAGTGSYLMSFEGNGQIIIAASCSATSTIAIRGNITVTDNAGGAVTLSDDARVDEDHVIAWADAALVAQKLDHLVAVADSDDVVDNAIMAKIAATGGDWSTFVPGTDSLQAFRDEQVVFQGVNTAVDASILIGIGDIKGTGFAKDTHSLPQCLTATSVTVSDKTGFSLAADQSAVTIGTVTTVINVPTMLRSTTAASVATQTSFILTAGSDDDNAYNFAQIVISDASNNNFPSVRRVSDYVGATRTVTLNAAPDFTMIAGDGIKVFVSRDPVITIGP